MPFLEVIPVALAIYLWNGYFHKRKILFYVDNLAVVSIINTKKAKSEPVLRVLRFIVYLTLVGNFHIKSVYIES